MIHDQDRTPDSTEGGQVTPPIDPPHPPPNKQTAATLLLIAAGFASLAALVSFLLACGGGAADILIDVGVLTAVLAMVLDSLAAHTQGGQINPPVQLPHPPPGLAYTTAANIAAALGLLAVLLGCVLDQSRGTTYAGFLALLLSAVLSFMAAYKTSSSE